MGSVCRIGYTRQQVCCDLGPQWHKSVGVSTDMHVEHGNGHLALMQDYAMATSTSPSLEEGGPKCWRLIFGVGSTITAAQWVRQSGPNGNSHAVGLISAGMRALLHRGRCMWRCPFRMYKCGQLKLHPVTQHLQQGTHVLLGNLVYRRYTIVGHVLH